MKFERGWRSGGIRVLRYMGRRQLAARGNLIYADNPGESKFVYI
jgi:hypothetical protein